MSSQCHCNVNPLSGVAGGQSNGPSTTRSAGKGRRRRAAAEMRRIEQQRWGEALVAPDDDASSDVSPSPTEAARASLMQQTASARRRQQRRVSRRQLREGQREIEEFFEREGEQDGEEEWRWGYGVSSSNSGRSGRGRSRGQQTSSSVPWSHFGGFADGDELEMALALSLSLVDHPIAASDSTGSLSDAAAAAASGDLSYESLTELESVQCGLSGDQIDHLPTLHVGTQHSSDSFSDELCSICQGEYVEGDALLVLPCQHRFHRPCATEWLSQYSKLCPVCKAEACHTAGCSGSEEEN
ncbi:unnamed protein product [Closterium sp. NIES-65]|nr:unnamed protein product [Closterium sp. NIES-65]